MENNLGSTSLLVDPNENRPISDIEVRKKTIRKIADEFLDVDEVSLESRAYLVKTTLPSVVVGLEQLIHEMKIRDIPLIARKQILKHPDQVQKDKPNSTFDSLNWLAQNLLRNNPKFKASIGDSTYVDRVAEVAQNLEERIHEIEADKERIRIANEISKLLELERLEKERQTRLAAIRARYTEELAVTFKLWISSLWRKEGGNLFKQEIVSQLQILGDFPGLQTDKEFIQKIQGLLKIITTPNSPLPAATPDNSIFDSSDPLYSLDCATILRWDEEFYIKTFLRLIIEWTPDQLTKYLSILSSMLVENGAKMNGIYNANIYIPKFPKIIVIRDWFQQLSNIIPSMDLSESPLKDSIKKAFQFFCVGKEEPRFTFVPSPNAPDDIIENENSAIGFAETAYVRFTKCVLGEFGVDVFKLVMTQLEREIKATVTLSEAKTQVSEPLKNNASPVMEPKVATEEQPKVDQARVAAESTALKNLETIRKNNFINVKAAGDEIIKIVEKCYSEIYNQQVVMGRLVLKETGVLKLTEGKNGVINQDDQISDVGVVESYYRLISCSKPIESDLLGNIIRDSGLVDAHMINKRESVLAPKCSDEAHVARDIFFTKTKFKNAAENSTFAGTFIAGSAPEAIGAASFLMLNGQFVAADLSFLEKAFKIASSIIELIDRREKSIELILNAKAFIEARLGGEVDAYLSESDEVYRVVESPNISIEKESDQPRLMNVLKTVKSKAPLQSENVTYRPVCVNNTCRAVLAIKGINEEQTADIERFLNILNMGITHIDAEEFGKAPDKYDLDAERCDNASRRKLLFGKLLLLSARKAISKIDSKALAELKSYKKPPKSIHLMVKGPLYLFGHKQAEMKSWIESVRLLNENFISQILAYDPTVPQKVARVKRAERITKALSWRDVNQKASEPAQRLFEWLCIALLLRDIAVKSRKARPELFDRVSTADSNSTEDDLETLDGEIESPDGEIESPEEESAGVYDADGNEIKSVDLNKA